MFNSKIAKSLACSQLLPQDIYQKTSKKHQLIKLRGKCQGSPQLLTGAEDGCAVQTLIPQYYQIEFSLGAKLPALDLLVIVFSIFVALLS